MQPPPPLLWWVFHTVNGVHIKIESVGLTPNGGTTVHVLWSVLEQAMAAVVVLNMVEWHSLETSPAQWQDDGVPGLKYTTMPAVFLQSHLYNHTNKRFKNTLLSISLSMHIYKYIHTNMHIHTQYINKHIHTQAFGIITFLNRINKLLLLIHLN